MSAHPALCAPLLLVLFTCLPIVAMAADAELPLTTALDAALRAEDWEAALAPAESLVLIAQAAHLEALQRLLGIHCRRGDREQAYATLAALLDAGYWDFPALRQDPALAAINQEERFRSLVRRAWSKQYIAMLERDSRDAMQMPEAILAALALKPGERVADLGAGSGYFTLRLAAAVGERGKVWALDIRQEMLDHIAGRLAEAELTNVELKQVLPDDPQLPVGAVDTVFMVDTMHYIKDRRVYAEKLRAGLAPGGRVVIIDFRYDPQAQREFAPPLEQQVPEATLIDEFAAAGLMLADRYDFLPEQYFLVFRVK